MKAQEQRNEELDQMRELKRAQEQGSAATDPTKMQRQKLENDAADQELPKVTVKSHAPQRPQPPPKESQVETASEWESNDDQLAKPRPAAQRNQ